MRVVVTGSSGFIGSALCAALRRSGHEVVRLVRRTPQAADERGWDPAQQRLDPAAVADADAVVHLAGAGVGDHRWTEDYKRTILDSRVNGTATVAAALADAPADRPRVLVCGSAVGFYGDTGDNAVDETAPAGSDFLARVTQAWEDAAEPARQAGVRVVLARTGSMVLGRGGPLARLLLPFRLGVGGRLGSGRQWVSWISLEDEVAALMFLARADIEGPVNLTAPAPVRNSELTRAVARAVHRPALLAVPAPALRAAVGGLTDGALLVSQRVLPARLDEAGFDFTHPDVDAALQAAV